MKRALTLLLTTMAVVGLGCGYNSYESRMAGTDGTIKEQLRLDHYLIPAPQDKFQEFGFFIRPPKPLEPTKKFQPVDLPDGMYDVDGSFLSTKGASGPINLHVLGRRKLAKKAPSKKPTAADTAPRGPFTQDVQGLLGTVFGGAIQPEVKAATVEKDKKKYTRQIFPLNETTKVHVYYYNEKFGSDTYDAALIWELPTTVPQSLDTAMDLTLKSFAVGPKAMRAFRGEAAEEGEPGAEGGAAAGPAAPF
jgi:hypothetical protein